MIASLLRCSSALVLFAALGACDSAERRAETGVEGQHPPGTSQEFESCATTSDCTGTLRCLQERCVTNTRSRLGDFYAAQGRRALAAGEPETAALAYNEAITTYEKESVTPPLELLCEQGMALSEAREDTQLAEAAARVLHKCVLAVPPASTLAKQAMDALAALKEVGLDENLLARSETADLYLTGESSGPDLSNLSVQVSSDGKTTKSSFNEFVEALRADDNKGAFQKCWEAAWKKHKQEQLDVSLMVTYRFFLDPDDAARDRASISVEEVPGLSGAAQEASQCVHTVASAAATAMAKSMRQDTRWKSKIRIQIGEGG